MITPRSIKNREMRNLSSMFVGRPTLPDYCGLRSFVYKAYLSWKGYYNFRYTYFDKWARCRLHRYLGWQLPDRRHDMIMRMCSIDEYKSLKSVICEFAKEGDGIKSIMDYSCGIGRSSVFLINMLNLNSARLYLVDGDSKIYGPKALMSDPQRSFHDVVKDIFSKSASFYTDLDLTDRFVVSNGIQNYSIINVAGKHDFSAVNEPVDLFYSFHAIGYHWDISNTFEYYDLDSIIRRGGLVIFGARRPNDMLACKLDVSRFTERGYDLICEIEGERLQKYLIFKKR